MSNNRKKKRVTPNKTFQDQVASATLGKFQGYIDQQIITVTQAVARELNQQLVALYERHTVLENIVTDKLNITQEELALMVADFQDEKDGYISAPETNLCKESDRVRILIKTKTKDQDEFQGQSKMLIDNCGSGNTIGKELESGIIGMKVGDSKELPFGDGMVAFIELIKISIKEENNENKNA